MGTSTPPTNIIYRLIPRDGRRAHSAPIPSRDVCDARHRTRCPARRRSIRETDIGWARDGSMFVSDGYGNSRVAKYDKDGNLSKPGVNAVRVPATSTRRTVRRRQQRRDHVADRGNSRIQTFDTEGNLKNVWNCPRRRGRCASRAAPTR